MACLLLSMETTFVIFKYCIRIFIKTGDHSSVFIMKWRYQYCACQSVSKHVDLWPKNMFACCTPLFHLCCSWRKSCWLCTRNWKEQRMNWTSTQRPWRKLRRTWSYLRRGLEKWVYKKDAIWNTLSTLHHNSKYQYHPHDRTGRPNKCYSDCSSFHWLLQSRLVPTVIVTLQMD